MTIEISFDKFETNYNYILADELELICLLNDSTDKLSRSKIESIFKLEGGGVHNFDKTCESLLSQFFLRNETFPNYYPFSFEEGLLIKKENWQNENKYKLYLNLLVASRLRFLNESSRQVMAKNFERICLAALKGWIKEFRLQIVQYGF